MCCNPASEPSEVTCLAPARPIAWRKLLAGGGARGWQRSYWIAAALVGPVPAAASHLDNSRPELRFVFGAYLGAVMAHFVTDACLWRMRDPIPARSSPPACRTWCRQPGAGLNFA